MDGDAYKLVEYFPTYRVGLEKKYVLERSRKMDVLAF